MDDETDRVCSRAPELEDLLGLCWTLNRAGVRYLLIGGFAVILHGFVRTTKDVALLVDPSDDNIQAIKRALSALPDNAAQGIALSDLREHTVVRVADEIVVDLMASACGVTYDEAQRHGVEECRIEDVAIPLAGKRLLIRLKDTARDSDRMDVRFLETRLQEENR